MKCPVDGSDLTMSERNGIEIDYCPKCRGVWLDRGELDKIIERAEADSPPRQAAAPAAPPPQQHQPYQQQPPQRGYYDNDRDHRYRDDDDDRRGYGYGHKKRRKSILGEIFDFD